MVEVNMTNFLSKNDNVDSCEQTHLMGATTLIPKKDIIVYHTFLDRNHIF